MQLFIFIRTMELVDVHREGVAVGKCVPCQVRSIVSVKSFVRELLEPGKHVILYSMNCELFCIVDESKFLSWKRPRYGRHTWASYVKGTCKGYFADPCEEDDSFFRNSRESKMLHWHFLEYEYQDNCDYAPSGYSFCRWTDGGRCSS